MHEAAIEWRQRSQAPELPRFDPERDVLGDRKMRR